MKITIASLITALKADKNAAIQINEDGTFKIISATIPGIGIISAAKMIELASADGMKNPENCTVDAGESIDSDLPDGKAIGVRELEENRDFPNLAFFISPQADGTWCQTSIISGCRVIPGI
ncbi:MAG: hypothetical protein COY40_05265 [Alphaproteobacteria bacterium CG_4_10_14_0_8_um_filter_53_9]|nr:MAG: hypothetical protein COY40_05265 [Alphaproteobacteria bacterium CG_4_10_14_0_8_um_filter_53_9]